MITEKDIAEAYGLDYDKLEPAQLRRLDVRHKLVTDALREDAHAVCYILHNSCHLPYVFIDEERKTYMYHANSLFHTLDPRSVENTEGVYIPEGYMQEDI